MTGSTNADFSSFSTDYCGLTSSSTSCSGLLSLPHKLVPIVHNWLDKGEHISYAEPIRYFLSNIWIRTLKDPVGTWWTLELKVYIKSELDWSNHLQQFLALIIKHGESIERKGKKGRGSGREGEREREWRWYVAPPEVGEAVYLLDFLDLVLNFVSHLDV